MPRRARSCRCTEVKRHREAADAPNVLRFSFACSVIVSALVWAAGALAGGPVFAVVPSGGGAEHGSLSQAIGTQLKAERRALLESRRLVIRDTALLRRAQAELLRAASPFPAEARAARLQQAIAAGQARASRSRRSIRGLELALRPVAPPADLLSSPSSSIGSYAASIAERYLNVRYVWGGSNPSTGFDCSGFVKFVYAQLGIQLPHYAATQYATTMHVDPSQLQAGDLVFFEPRADGPGHVGLYLGNDLFIEAPHTGDVVKIAHLSTEAGQMGFVGATRPAV
jgi:cell wall-associated NlpC family hydrolase